MSATSPSLLHLDTATTRAGARTFGPFSFSVHAGEQIAILGPSGAGKSTLLKLISHELPLASGSYLYGNRPIATWSLVALSKQRAVLPQSHEVAFGLPVELVIGLGRVARMHDPQLSKIIREAATLACCAHLLERRFDTLSGGEKARVQLARIFAQLWDVRDGLLLVDEPIAALDPGLQFDLMDAIGTFASARNHAVLAVLHDINHALANFTRVLLVKNSILAGDAACDASVVTQLASLYDITLETMTDSDGALFVKPVRQKPASRVAA